MLYLLPACCRRLDDECVILCACRVSLVAQTMMRRSYQRYLPVRISDDHSSDIILATYLLACYCCCSAAISYCGVISVIISFSIALYICSPGLYCSLFRDDLCIHDCDGLLIQRLL
jgi:hypothetical protein